MDAISELEQALGDLHSRLVFWTAVVALGLVIEYGPPFWDLGKKLLRRVLRGEAVRGLAVHVLVGGVLITGGVAMEMVVERDSQRVEKKLGFENRKLEAKLQEAAKIAEVRISESEAREKEAEARIRDSEVKIAESTRRTREAEARISEAELNLVILNTPRSVGGDVSEAVAKLRKFAGTEYDFRANQEPEPLALMVDVDRVLGFSGWVRKPSPIYPANPRVEYRGIPFSPAVSWGVEVQTEGPTAWDAGNALLDVLYASFGKTSSSTEVLGSPLTRAGPNRVHVLIGAKKGLQTRN
jgi:hypothetical protein